TQKTAGPLSLWIRCCPEIVQVEVSVGFPVASPTKATAGSAEPTGVGTANDRTTGFGSSTVRVFETVEHWPRALQTVSVTVFAPGVLKVTLGVGVPVT